MIPNPDFDAHSAADSRLSDLARLAGRLGYEIVDIAGFLDTVDEQSRAQIAILRQVEGSAKGVLEANSAVRAALEEVTSVTEQTQTTVEGSIDFVRTSGQKSNSVAAWVTAVSDRMQKVAASLEAVEANNAIIADIARQVNILAINAKIEAARAGESGRGFGVVAEAINELSRKTAQAAEGIEENVTTLSTWVGKLSDEAKSVSHDATAVLDGAEETDRVLGEIAQGVERTSQATRTMGSEAEKVRTAVEEFEPAFEKIGRSAEKTAQGIHEAHDRVNKLIDTSEDIYRTTVDLGGASEDAEMIDVTMTAARQIGQVFEEAVATGRISMEALFDRTYTEVPDTNPVQYLARFTEFTDSVLPAIQEPIVARSDKMVFCAAVDQNGYLPTHNKKFSQPQGSDPKWNAANARNRRIFNDRVGLKAGTNEEPFLLQVYRRDMGGGSYMMMKDLSAPIVVKGRHWGGLRVAYKF
ncbi:methyl-accepting chemotaxis protein [Celeribacter sp.]|uniref:methyl-accepting chemotaxis protein n=1 Tax=Celeribacter sp. TaxID=1890673 RepID=UPI003A8D0E32